MVLTNYSRIAGSVDTCLLKTITIVGVGAGGAFGCYESLCRTGVGSLTVIDHDVIEEVNIVRQGYAADQIGRFKADALGDHLLTLNEGMKYTGIRKRLQELTEAELDDVFGHADLILMVTDSFPAQAYGNILAVRYQKAAIFAGFYERSRCAEIYFFIPRVTPGCFRCAVSPRYAAQLQSTTEITIGAGYNTMIHSMMLDSMIVALGLAILHNDTDGYEFSNWFGTFWDRNLIQFKTHPEYSSDPGSLFKRKLPDDGSCYAFSAIWQRIEREMPPQYPYCPDCFNCESHESDF